jgi:hypothetical protein
MLPSGIETLKPWKPAVTEETHMADLPRYPYADTDDDTGVRSDRGSTTSTSRWVYILWITVIALVLLFVVLHLKGTVGPHGH